MYSCPGSGIPGILKVYVKYGRRLPDRNGWFAGDSDPYVRVTAVDDRSQQTIQRTQYIQGNENPNWYRWLDFGGRISWQYFEMSTWDDDWGSDDKLLDYQTFTVSSGYHSNIQHCQDSTCSARVIFDYHLILDGNECSPNPCVCGTCTDLISNYQWINPFKVPTAIVMLRTSNKVTSAIPARIAAIVMAMSSADQ